MKQGEPTCKYLECVPMTAKELKRLRRSDLLEMLLELSKENQGLRKQLAEAEKKLEDRTILIEQSGSLAEAALRLNRIFEDAQAACQQYEQNVRQRCAQMEEQTRCRCEAMMDGAHRERMRGEPEWTEGENP